MKLATVGTSPITHRFLQATAEVPGLEPYCVYSRSFQTAQATGSPYGITVFYDDYAKMLADPLVKVVYIASPNSLHFEQTMQAINAGKAVICEKPFVSTMAEFSALKQKILEKQAFVFEAITTLYMPNYLLLKNALQQIAPLHMAKIDFTRYAPSYTQLMLGNSCNTYESRFSGGALYDVGVYCIHLAAGLFGAPLEVACLCNNTRFEVDTSGFLLLRYPELVCSLSFGKDCHSANTTEFSGEHGYITLSGSIGKCHNLTLTTGDGATCTIALTQAEKHMQYEAKHFTKSIAEKNFTAVEAALAHSETVLQILSKSRTQAGIRFAADQ